MPSLLDMLQGGSPAAPDEVSGGIAATLASDPSKLAYSSGPVGQALGQISGGFYQDQARAAAQRIADAHSAALPALLKAYSSEDPFTAIANDPAAPAYAKFMVGNQSPLQVAQTKAQLANAGLVSAKIPGEEAESAFSQYGLERLRAAGGPGAGVPGAGASRAGIPGSARGVGTTAAPPAPEPVPPEVSAALALPPGPDRMAAISKLPIVQQQMIARRSRRIPTAPAAGGVPPMAAPLAAPVAVPGVTMSNAPATAT
jgi:hypothetical protein